MSEWTPISLGTGSNPGRYQHGGVARHINCRLEKAGTDARVQYPLQATQGLARWATLANGNGTRAMQATDSELLVLAGRFVYSMDLGGIATLKGSIPSDGHAFMARNGRETGSQIGIVCNQLMYLYETATGTMSAVVDPDLLASPPTSICYLGGYFFMTTHAGQFIWSELDTGDSIDGLSVGTARESPDGLIVCAPRGRDLLLFGTQSLEIWTLNDGGGDAPVSRRTVLHGYGALSAGAVVSVNDTVFFLATNDQGASLGLFTLTGDTQQEIPDTEAFKRVVQDEPSPSDITSTYWTEDGVTEIAFSGTDWTWVLNLSTGKMHERSSSGGRWRVAKCAQFGAKIIAGSATLPRLYTMSKNYYDEDYDDLVMTVQPPPVHATPGRVEMNGLRLDVLPGVGAPGSTVIPMLDVDGTPMLDGDGNIIGERSATEDINPRVWLKISRDGISWSEPLYRDLGARGQRLTIAMWTRLGTSQPSGWHLEFGCSAAVSRAIYGASGQVKALPP